MEPNVDRGMWSVVALLAAIVIGGVVLLAFPKISGKIVNNMDNTVDKAFNGESPDWLISQEKAYYDDELVKRIKENEENLFKGDHLTFEKDFRGHRGAQVKVSQGYSIPELGIDKATKVESFFVEGGKETWTRFYTMVPGPRGTDPKYDYFVSTNIKNNSSSVIYFSNNYKRAIPIKPGESKRVYILSQGEIREEKQYVEFQYAILSEKESNKDDLEFIISDPFAARFEHGKYK